MEWSANYNSRWFHLVLTVWMRSLCYEFITSLACNHINRISMYNRHLYLKSVICMFRFIMSANHCILYKLYQDAQWMPRKSIKSNGLRLGHLETIWTSYHFLCILFVDTVVGLLFPWQTMVIVVIFCRGSKVNKRLSCIKQ